MVKKGVDSGEYIWHTVNSFEASRYDGIEFNDDIADAAAEVGERIYTTRTSYNAKLDGSDSMMMVDRWFKSAVCIRCIQIRRIFSRIRS